MRREFICLRGLSAALRALKRDERHLPIVKQRSPKVELGICIVHRSQWTGEALILKYAEGSAHNNYMGRFPPKLFRITLNHEKFLAGETGTVFLFVV